MKQPIPATKRNATIAAAIVATPLAVLALVGFTNGDAVHATAVTDLANEVAVQCADEANGTLDALAEGEAGTAAVPAPVWDDLVAACATVLDEGATADEAPDLVLVRLGAL